MSSDRLKTGWEQKGAETIVEIRSQVLRGCSTLLGTFDSDEDVPRNPIDVFFKDVHQMNRTDYLQKLSCVECWNGITTDHLTKCFHFLQPLSIRVQNTGRHYL